MARRTVVNLGGGVGVRTGELDHVLHGPITGDDLDIDANIQSANGFSGEANSGGGDTTISTDQSRPGFSKSLKLTVNTTGGASSGTRLGYNPPFNDASQTELRGYPKQPRNFGDRVFTSGWVYMPSYIDDNPNNQFFNLQQLKVSKALTSDWTSRTRQLIYHISPAGDATSTSFMPTLKTTAYPDIADGYVYNDDSNMLQGDDIVAGSDVRFPIGEWFHLENEVVRGTQGNRDGEIRHWLNGELLWDVRGILTQPVHPSNAWGYDWTSGDFVYEGCNQLTWNNYRNTGNGTLSIYMDGIMFSWYRAGPPLYRGAKGNGPRVMSRRFHRSWNSVSTNGSGFDLLLTPGDNRMVLIFVGTESTSAQGNVAVSSVTFGGNTCSLLTDGTNSAAEGYQSGDWNRVEIWACKESDMPADGWNDIVVTMASTVDEIIIQAWVIKDANQSYTVDAVALESRSAVSGWGSGSITTTAADCIIVDGLTAFGPAYGWPGNNQARMGEHRGDGTASLAGGYTSWRRERFAGTYSMTWEGSVNYSRLAHVIAAIAKA